jgi:hypothetical protein
MLKKNNIFLNSKYTNVGIGTDVPAQKLHIVDGNILISRTSTDSSKRSINAPASKNGSILFGDNIKPDTTMGEWGIEYYDGYSDYNHNGLNFWKPYNSVNGGGNSMDPFYIWRDTRL